MTRIQKNGIEVSNTIFIAINSPNNLDPLLQTGCFSSVVSSSTNTIAPAPHGPGSKQITTRILEKFGIIKN
jgi:hypothetical protein